MQKQEKFVKVRLLDASLALDKEYDYAVPEELSERVFPGCFVTVPFGGGNRRRLALCTGVTGRDPALGVIKKIESVTTPRISLSEEMLGLVSFLREQTLCTTGDAVHAMIPAGALAGLAEIYRPGERHAADARSLSTGEAYLLAYLSEAGSASAEALRARFGDETVAQLPRLCRMGLVRKELAVKDAMAEKERSFFARTDKTSAGRLGEKQKALLAMLEDGEKSDAELRAAGFTKAQTDALCKKGLLSVRTERVFRGMNPVKDGATPDFTLNREQATAFETLSGFATDGQAHAVLLHGVTGSGKTCVMLKLIDKMLSLGKGAIVLLPEIALTPQSLSIFATRYRGQVAVMHSALSAGERMDAYHRILSGEARVVVGTRSAVFAPVQNLGLIVLDEEHEHTYKSDMNPKYHARDVARYRAAANRATMLLCSATPSLESYKRAREGRYTLLTLTERHAGAVLPEVRLADMRREEGGGVLSPIGKDLAAALNETTEKGEQAILFLNRRGYNHTVSCRSCGQAVCCPSCSVSMTYHTKPGRYSEGFLLCHLCGKRMKLPVRCPSCGSEHLARFGFGTQRVEEELAARLPGKRILRMDTDTTGRRNSYDEMLGAFRRHEADVLLGTQMVTKGHDFPDVTLVGVLLADASLYLDDYRAAERTFSLLTQVVGRAGRAQKRGVAVIQTSNPDHEVIRLAAKQDYIAFFEREIRLRKLLVFPPFCDIVLLTLSHRNEREVMLSAKNLSEELGKRVSSTFSDVQLLAFGPFEAPVYRAEGRYRMRMVVKCALNRRSRALFREILLLFSGQGAGAPTLSVDFNPSSL